ncbi:MAG TPA: hypothetical protein VH854_15920 [Thermoanaerobaculia bacterium]|nr:hypothetical protein [Thermoanaerobaculia bacterium]
MLKKLLSLAVLGWAPVCLSAAPRKPTAVPTPIPTPVAPERVPSSQRKGAASDKRVTRYENPNVSFSKLTRVEEVDLDNDGVPEALVEGIGTVKSLPPEIPAVGFVSRTRLPFENPICAVFKKGKGNDWDVLLLAHLPQRCRQSDDPVRCDGLLAFRAVEFRYDDRPQVALQIVHSGETRVTETGTYRLDRDRLDTTFSASGPRTGLDVEFGPDGIVRRIAVDTFINKELPPRYRSFTLTSSYVFGERRFRIASETVDPEWGDRADLELSYWGLVHQSTFASDLTRLQDRQRRAPTEAAWSLDPVELVKKRFADARDVRVGSKRAGLAVVYFERVGCSAHIVLYQPLRETDGDKSIWDFAVIRSPEEPAYECLMEPFKGN